MKEKVTSLPVIQKISYLSGGCKALCIKTKMLVVHVRLETKWVPIANEIYIAGELWDAYGSDYNKF